MKNQELPSGWTWVRLSDICFTSSGGTPPRSQRQLFDGHIPWIKSGELRDELILDSDERISDEGLESCNAKIFPKGTVLVALYGATVGRTGVLGMDAATNQAVCAIFSDERVLNKMYLFYFLRSKRRHFLKRAFGVAQRNINQRVIRDTRIPLAPLGEQNLIADRIESLFEESNAIREALDKVTLLLRSFTQSILARAFRGELTQRDTYDGSAKKLLERIKKERWKKWRDELRSKGNDPKKHEYKEPDTTVVKNLAALPENWDWTTVGTIATFIGSGMTPRGGKKVYVKDGIPFIRSQNVYPDGLHLESVAHITPEFHAKMKRTHVKPGDVLLNITGASIGRCTYVPDNFGPANVNQHVCIIRTCNWVLSQYLSGFLNSQAGQTQIFSAQNGVTREGLNYGQLRSICIPLAPVEEQRRIVARIKELFAYADKIEHSASAARKHAGVIDDAILAKAFSGRLLSQNPNDEPASLLLQRVEVDPTKMKSRIFKIKEKIRPPLRAVGKKPVKPPSVLEILKKIGQATVDDVFRATGLNMNDFWDELKSEIDAGRIERVREGDLVLLKVRK